MAQMGDTSANASSSTAEGGGGSGGGGGGAGGAGASGADSLLPKKRSGFLPPSSGTAAAAESAGVSSSSSSAIAAATAAAIAAGPLKLGASASDASEGSGQGASPPLPLLEVRGCTPIGQTGSRFEINLGQQLAHSSSLEWQVSLMWPATRRVRRVSHSSSLLGAAGDGAGVGGISSGGGSSSRRIVSGGGGSSGRGGVTAAVAAAVKPILKFQLYTLHTSDAEWLTLGGQREGELTEGGVQVKYIDVRNEN